MKVRGAFVQAWVYIGTEDLVEEDLRTAGVKRESDKDGQYVEFDHEDADILKCLDDAFIRSAKFNGKLSPVDDVDDDAEVILTDDVGV